MKLVGARNHIQILRTKLSPLVVGRLCLVFSADDAICGASQALSLSCGGMLKDELDMFSRQLLLLDPSVQRAFDCLSRRSLPTPLTNYHLQLILDNLRARSVNEEEDVFLWSDLFLMIPTENPAVRYHFQLAMAVVIFNQGLILHCGKVNGTRRRLERALEFYNIADRWYFDVCGQQALSAYDYRNSVGCAILNNAGFVTYQLGHGRASESFFTRLSILLLGLDPPTNEVERVRREELVLNVALFSNSPRTAPAA